MVKTSLLVKEFLGPGLVLLLLITRIFLSNSLKKSSTKQNNAVKSLVIGYFP